MVSTCVISSSTTECTSTPPVAKASSTRVTAAAIAMNYCGETKRNLITLNTKGGDLQVSFEKENDLYVNIWLIGPATQVYKGDIEW